MLSDIVERAIPIVEVNSGQYVGSEFWRPVEKVNDLKITLTKVCCFHHYCTSTHPLICFQTERGEFRDIEIIGRPSVLASEMHRSVIPNKPSSAVTHTQSYKHRHAQLAMIKKEIFPYNPDLTELIVCESYCIAFYRY